MVNRPPIKKRRTDTMDLGISGKLAIVTGASEGIGFETAKGLAEEGADVVLVSRNAEKLAAAAKRIKDQTGHDARFVACDITKAGDVDALAGWVAGNGPALDILVSSVGGSVRKAFEDLTDADWLANYEFNVLGNVRLVRALLPALRQGRNPAVVLFSAAGGKQPYPLQGVSNVHKAGVLGLVKTLAYELCGDGIRVNSVSPGRTVTPLWTKRFDSIAQESGTTPGEVQAEFAAEIPIGRFGRPEEPAAVAVFLCSEKASYMMGQAVGVDGGMVRAHI